MRDDGHRIARLDSVTIDCHDPERLAAFWASMFGTVEEWRGGIPQYIDLGGDSRSVGRSVRRWGVLKTR